MSHRASARIKQVQSAVSWAESILELTDKEVGSALGASARTVARWRGSENQPSERHVVAAERLLELSYALDVVFGEDMERLHAWLHEPLPALKGRTPLRAIIDGRLEELLTILANVESGVFT